MHPDPYGQQSPQYPPTQQWPAMSAAPPPARAKRSRVPWIVGGVAAVVALCCGGTMLLGAMALPKPEPAAVTEPAPSPSPTPSDPATGIPDRDRCLTGDSRAVCKAAAKRRAAARKEAAEARRQRERERRELEDSGSSSSDGDSYQPGSGGSKSGGFSWRRRQ
ncbi:hypothetical protein GCM10010124_41180 [Pilimelia terevasa]|uniref:Uncharacterized protein n=1 Tax=Pilimelia terevasa TaxID=53372 RepID=A0A8J3BQV0_9ACTN|nr:hypothetical protein [Pilimelia terevasa]GGK44120.1 hypothetical protein GCM10010124_41180 [Pilimelia terevasa]